MSTKSKAKLNIKKVWSFPVERHCTMLRDKFKLLNEDNWLFHDLIQNHGWDLQAIEKLRDGNRWRWEQFRSLLQGRGEALIFVYATTPVPIFREDQLHSSIFTCSTSRNDALRLAHKEAQEIVDRRLRHLSEPRRQGRAS